MDPIGFTYLLAAISCFLLGGGYFLLRFILDKKGVDAAKPLSIYRLVAGIVSLTLFFAMMFFVPIAMNTKAIYRNDHYDTSVGNVALIGVPYGDNKIGNVFAWLSITLFLPASAFALLSTLYPSKRGILINRYFSAPVLLVVFATLFNLDFAYMGTFTISYKGVLLSLTVGLNLALSLIGLFEDKKVKIEPKKDIPYMVGYLFVGIFAFLPMGTFAMFVPVDCILFGRIQYSWRVFSFSFVQRLYIYIGISYFVLTYFLARSDDIKGKRAILIVLALGALSSFFTEYGFEGIWEVSNHYRLMVTRLPIHLCHTALFIVPLAIAFDWKRIFYFTYFINVFGAFAAMVWPNNGEFTNMFDPSVLLFWWNHMNAFCMPLLTVSLKVFDRPKMKQMRYSLGAFAIYFIAIMFANGYLSNFVPGYRPGVLGSGTDYLFINNDYILGIFGDEAKKMLNIKVQFNSGDLVLVYYPLYQSLFFIGYVCIAFLMWFVYSLFYRIHDSHEALHDRLVLIKGSHLKWKEARAMEEAQRIMKTEQPELAFHGFCKRYGNSPKLSANQVELTIYGGEIFGFLGPNGAGKSTCIKSAIGIQPLSDGTIEVCGHDIANDSVAAKSLIGYVPDHYALYEKLTGREYISYFADIYHVSAEDRKARMEDLVSRFELEDAFDARIETYSHGMKQKIAIMAALIHEPKVWILDEPLTGLDPQSVYQVKQTMIAHAEKGNVVFFSSHIIDVVERLCTHIAIIKAGKIVYEGSTEETLKNHPEGLEKFYLSVIGEANGERE